MEPTHEFYAQDEDKKKLRWGNILHYFYPYTKLFLQLGIGFIIGIILQLITPLLTQYFVDIGINSKNINFIYSILIAQVMLFIGQTAVSFMRSWILLHISTRINISILTDLLSKLLRREGLPNHSKY